MSTKPVTPFAAIVGLMAGIAAITILVIVGRATDHDSFAKGIAIGGAVALLALAFLWWRGARGGTAARIASGNADERERRITREAFADTGIAMMCAAVGMTIATLWDVEAVAVGGVILWTGLITFLVSVGVRARRS